MTYTQGPWKFEVRNNQAMVTTERDDIDMVVASNLFDEELDLELEEVEANARLIASAPDLLFCLQKWMSFQINSGLEGCDEIVEQTEKAIAKATGAEVEA